MMRLSDDRARAIAEAAIDLENAKQAVLTQQRKRREFFNEHFDSGSFDVIAGGYVNYPAGGWDTEENEALHMASYDIEGALMKTRDSKRRAYQRQIKSALLENAS